MSIQTLVLVAAGSALGGMARYGLSVWIANRSGASFPWGTLAVNVSGSFAIGLIFGFTGSGDLFLEAPTLHQVATYGFLGGYTTFSTFGLEAINLLREGDRRGAAAYVAGSVAAGISAAAVGFLIGGLGS